MKTYKILFLLLLIFIAFNSCNKKTHSYRIDMNEKFKHQYIFSFEDTDTSRVKIEKKEATKSRIKGTVSDKYGTMLLCYIQLTSIDGYFKKTIGVDFDGKFEQEISKGRYRIQTLGSMSEHLNFEFEIQQNTELNFDIYLKNMQLPTIYQINSEKPLSRRRVEKIKNCIKENENKETKEYCWEEGENYSISIQI